MDIISAEEWQLTSFFEVPPSYSDPEESWPYADAVFELERDGLSLSCAIAPAYRDVRLIIRCGDTMKYELSAIHIRDVVCTKDSSGEVLHVVLDESEYIELRVKPKIIVAHRVDNQLK